ncbi:MAG TPA: HlyD family efflux transporter periplasmic adaptor subunit [bacterium]|nr:HlyD family efflux transporter periplasmic adaptor subunit [bacterium]HOL35541.1 HlyD family efflux transporter periplasmic adaptor subunit [bacterium]HPP07966.1 HlyD family efflux transporter periplasmic adaptor subunit [bacterium]
MKLRSKPSFIRVGEPEIPQKKKHIDRYIYLGLIILIIIFALFMLAHKSIYISGYGQVIIPYVDVQPIDDIRILKYYVKEGQSVMQNDILFAYMERPRETGGNEFYNLGLRDRENLARQAAKIELEKNFVRKNTELAISELKEQIAWKEKEKIYYQNLLRRKIEQLEQLKKMVLLETYLPYNIKNLEEEIEKTKFQIAKIDSEISTIKQEIVQAKEKQDALIAKLDAEKNLLKSDSRIFWISGEKQEIHNFPAPIDGIVARIYREEKEVVLKGDNVMSICKIGETKIKGYFEQKDYPYLAKNKMVTIQFPDGSKKQGIITNVYFATMPQPPEFQKKYEPLHRSVIVDILPCKWEIEPFKEIYKMSVKLYVLKFSTRGEKWKSCLLQTTTP